MSGLRNALDRLSRLQSDLPEYVEIAALNVRDWLDDHPDAETEILTLTTRNPNPMGCGVLVPCERDLGHTGPHAYQSDPMRAAAR